MGRDEQALSLLAVKVEATHYPDRRLTLERRARGNLAESIRFGITESVGFGHITRTGWLIRQGGEKGTAAWPKQTVTS